MTRNQTTAGITLFLLLASLVMGGCEGGIKLPDIPRSAYLLGPNADPTAAKLLKSEIYPAEAKLGDDLDIVVVREGGQITIVNRTAVEYDNVQIWLNQQYVGLLPKIKIGTKNRFNLNTFINQHGEGFPVGGLLTPDRSYPVVLAELYLPPDGRTGNTAEQGPAGESDATNTSDATTTNEPPTDDIDDTVSESPVVPIGRRHRLTVRDMDRHIMR